MWKLPLSLYKLCIQRATHKVNQAVLPESSHHNISLAKAENNTILSSLKLHIFHQTDIFILLIDL